MPVYYIRKIMLCPVALSKQTQLFHLVAVLCAGGHDVDARRVDAAVTENICQFCNILLHTIESPGKELPQIVGKHLVRIYVCLRTQPLHGRPDIAAVHRLAGPGTEDMPAFNPRAAHVLQQDVLQPPGNQNASRLILARDGDFSGLNSLHREILQLGYADSRGAERLQQQPQPLIFPGSVQKPQVSVLLSSRFAARYVFFCTRYSLTLQSALPQKTRKLLSEASMELTDKIV